jgi:DNA polymerase-3 subunit gamma/tau
VTSAPAAAATSPAAAPTSSAAPASAPAAEPSPAAAEPSPAAAEPSPAAAEPSPAAVAVVDSGAPDGNASSEAELSLESFEDVWPAVVDSLRADAPMLATLLEDARPAALAGEGLTLAWPESSAFSKRKAEDPANRELIAGAIRAVTGSSLRLAYELRADHELAAPAASAAPAMSEDELVRRLMDEFDAEELPPEPEEQS